MPSVPVHPPPTSPRHQGEANLLPADGGTERGGIEVELAPLPGARTEARAIAELIAPERRTLLLGPDALEKTVREQSPEHGIIHLATHGMVYDDKPLASFVALTEENRTMACSPPSR